MYERSANILEKYYNNILGFGENINLKTIFKNYKDLVEELQKYQVILEEEDKIINEFDEEANEIREIQQEQKKIYKVNIKLEEDRNQLFDSLDEEPDVIDKKLKKIEENINSNNKRLEELREKFVNLLTDFSNKQQERNKCSRARRAEEKIHLQIIEECSNDLNDIDISVLKNIKEFLNTEEKSQTQEIIKIMTKNGKDERVPFNKNVIENAVISRNEIAKREAECYLLIYERMKRLLLEINNDEIKLDKYNKALRDVTVKLEFLKAKKMYIVSFLDNERITAMNGIKVHNKLMDEACKNFELDMEQFNNLFELILKEISGRSTQKAYRELYNKEYLKNIAEKEKNFEKEANSIKINTGTIINSNYWRIEEIKNIYQVFQNEVSEKFKKDLSEFKLVDEEIEEDLNETENEIIENDNEEDDIFKTKIPNEDVEYIEEYEYDDDDDFDYDLEDEDDIEEEDLEDDKYIEKEDIDDEEDEEFFEEDDDEYFDEDEYEDDDFDDEENDNDDSKTIEKNKTQESNKKGKGLFNKFFK